MKKKTYTDEPMWQILEWLQEEVNTIEPMSSIEFNVPDPDYGAGSYAGTPLLSGEINYIYRSYKAWSDLAEICYCRMLTPRQATEGFVTLRFQKIDTNASFHSENGVDKVEKYGSDSAFAAIRKNEEPAFLAAYLKALRSVNVASRRRILDLGINSGDEFELIRDITGSQQFKSMELVGVDHSSTAITVARERFPEENVRFYDHDINALNTLQLGRFDLIITIGTLQSPGIDFKPFFMSLVQDYLMKNEGAMILGFPNCRWMGGEMIYGAKAPNYPYPEMSLLYKDVYYCKKYLQQKGFRVTLTGKEYVFLTATSIKKKSQDVR